MRHLHSLVFVGLVITTLLAGCSSGSVTTGASATTNTPIATLTATATADQAAPTTSSHPVATNTPKPASHPPTATAAATTKNCGSITTSSTSTTPSNPQPLEDCFTQAFMACQPATLDITFKDSTTTTADAMNILQGCGGASVQEHKHTISGGTTTDTTTTITCVAIVPSGQKYSLRECSNNEWISFP